MARFLFHHAKKLLYGKPHTRVDRVGKYALFSLSTKTRALMMKKSLSSCILIPLIKNSSKKGEKFLAYVSIEKGDLPWRPRKIFIKSEGKHRRTGNEPIIRSFKGLEGFNEKWKKIEGGGGGKGETNINLCMRKERFLSPSTFFSEPMIHSLPTPHSSSLRYLCKGDQVMERVVCWPLFPPRKKTKQIQFFFAFLQSLRVEHQSMKTNKNFE